MRLPGLKDWPSSRGDKGMLSFRQDGDPGWEFGDRSGDDGDSKGEAAMFVKTKASFMGTSIVGDKAELMMQKR